MKFPRVCVVVCIGQTIRRKEASAQKAIFSVDTQSANNSSIELMVSPYEVVQWLEVQYTWYINELAKESFKVIFLISHFLPSFFFSSNSRRELARAGRKDWRLPAIEVPGANRCGGGGEEALLCHPGSDPQLQLLRGAVLTLLEPQSRFGGKPVKFQVVCPQNGTAALKGLNGIYGTDKNLNISLFIPTKFGGTHEHLYISLFFPTIFGPTYHDPRRAIVNRTYGIHEHLHISLFLPTIFGPIYYGSR